VAQALEPRLRPEVVANRVRPAGAGWRLETFETSLPRLRRMLRAAQRAPSDPAVLLSTDIQDFFPSVSPGPVARALESLGAPGPDVAEAAAMLEGWASLGYPGLPIGPPTSAVLANAVLRSVDEAVRVPFVRWVDDYLAVVRGEAQAAEILERMDEALARLGLSRSSRKTRLGPNPGCLGSALGASSRSDATSA
jgi:hypothetical protein